MSRAVHWHEIGSAEHPVRMSSLTHLHCLARFALMLHDDRPSGEAAQTGTLAHVGIEEWLKGSRWPEIRRVLEDRRNRFREAGEKLGNLSRAIRLIETYVHDPRNAPIGERPRDPEIGVVIDVELPVVLRLPAIDETGDIYVAGTLDQLREHPDTGALGIVDAKTGRAREYCPTLQYVAQLAGYAGGAAQQLGREIGSVQVFGVYNCQAPYDDEPSDPWYPSSLTARSIPVILESYAEQIVRLRHGEVSPLPGPWCEACYVAKGPQDCTQRVLNL